MCVYVWVGSIWGDYGFNHRYIKFYVSLHCFKNKHKPTHANNKKKIIRLYAARSLQQNVKKHPPIRRQTFHSNTPKLIQYTNFCYCWNFLIFHKQKNFFSQRKQCTMFYCFIIFYLFLFVSFCLRQFFFRLFSDWLLFFLNLNITNHNISLKRIKK